MNRYDAVHDDAMVADEQGDWVRYEDAAPMWRSAQEEAPRNGLYWIDDPRREGVDLMCVEDDGIGGALSAELRFWHDYWCPGMRIAGPVRPPSQPAKEGT